MPRVTERDVEILNPRRVLSGTPHSLHAAAPATLQRERRCGSRRCPVGRSVAHGGRESGTRSLRSRAGDHPRPRGGRRRARIESRRGRRLLPHRARHFRAQRAGVARAHGAHGRIRGDAEPRAVHRSRTGIERRLPARGGTTRETARRGWRSAFVYTARLAGDEVFVLDATPPGDAGGDGVEDHPGCSSRTPRLRHARSARRRRGGRAGGDVDAWESFCPATHRCAMALATWWPPGVDRTLADHLEQRAETLRGGGRCSGGWRTVDRRCCRLRIHRVRACTTRVLARARDRPRLNCASRVDADMNTIANAAQRCDWHAGSAAAHGADGRATRLLLGQQSGEQLLALGRRARLLESGAPARSEAIPLDLVALVEGAVDLLAPGGRKDSSQAMIAPDVPRCVVGVRCVCVRCSRTSSAAR